MKSLYQKKKKNSGVWAEDIVFLVEKLNLPINIQSFGPQS